MHEPRYGVLLDTIRRLVLPEPRILDVGAADEATLLRRLSGATVDTLGFDDERFPPGPGERHVRFDLKEAERRDAWPELEPYDLVVCAEVIEHLPVAPQHVVAFLASALRPGGWLVLQTPNAARLANRVRLLAGKNPFEPLRPDSTSPGHFREYTVDELLDLARAARGSTSAAG
jgi:SAM-dependent methyltransferase